MIEGDLLSRLLSPNVNAVRYAPRRAKKREEARSTEVTPRPAQSPQRDRVPVAQ